MAILIKENDLTRRAGGPEVEITYGKPSALELIKCRLWHRLTGHWHIEWSNWIPFIVCSKCHMSFHTDRKRSYSCKEAKLSNQIEQEISEVVARKERDLAAV